MIGICGRKVKVVTRRKSQTVRICTSDNVHGIYEYVIRLRPPFVTAETISQQNPESVPSLVEFLTHQHSGQIEQGPGLPALRPVPHELATGVANPAAETEPSNETLLAEAMMALDIHGLFVEMGLKSRFRVDICSGISDRFAPGTYDHQLPLYAKQTDKCFMDKARQVARCDLIVVDTEDKIVDVTLEFELDTNPKNLVGNYFCVFKADEYKPKNELNVYKLDVMRTAHFLLACLNPRGTSPNEQAALEKGIVVAEWLDRVGTHLAGDADLCSIRIAHALAGDNWQVMKQVFARALKLTCPHLFNEDSVNSCS